MKFSLFLWGHRKIDESLTELNCFCIILSIPNLYREREFAALRENYVIFCTSQIEASTSPLRATPWALELLKIGLFKFPPLGAKKPFKCPTNKYWNKSPQRQISSSIKHCSHFRERYAVMIPSNFLWRPYWKSYSLTKAKFYLVNPSNLAKTEKTHRNITPEQQVNPVQIPHPSKATFKFPPSRAQCTVKCPGYARGVDVEASIWPVHLTEDIVLLYYLSFLLYLAILNSLGKRNNVLDGGRSHPFLKKQLKLDNYDTSVFREAFYLFYSRLYTVFWILASQTVV